MKKKELVVRLTVDEAFEQYADRVFSAAFSICQNRADADDIVQSTFFKYYSMELDYDSESHIKAWLLRVAVNQAKDLLKSFWRHGEQSNAVLELTENGYEVNFEGEDGRPYKMHGFAIKEGYYGEERSMTEEEIMEHLKMPDVEYKDDGSVWVYYEDQKLEITDQFEENGICKIRIKDKYITICYRDGFAYSDAGFPNANSFRTKPSKS